MYVKLENRNPPHNKEYHIGIREQPPNWVVDVSYGRIGSSLQNRTYPFTNRSDAIAFGRTGLETRFSHGYSVVDFDNQAYGEYSDVLPERGFSEDEQGNVRERREAVPVRTHVRRTTTGRALVRRHIRRTPERPQRRMTLRGEVIEVRGGKMSYKKIWNGLYMAKV